MNTSTVRGFVRLIAGPALGVMLPGGLGLLANDGTNSPLLTLKRIYAPGDFNGDDFAARWLKDGPGHTTFEGSTNTPGARAHADIVDEPGRVG